MAHDHEGDWDFSGSEGEEDHRSGQYSDHKHGGNKHYSDDDQYDDDHEYEQKKENKETGSPDPRASPTGGKKSELAALADEMNRGGRSRGDRDERRGGRGGRGRGAW